MIYNVVKYHLQKISSVEESKLCCSLYFSKIAAPSEDHHENVLNHHKVYKSFGDVTGTPKSTKYYEINAVKPEEVENFAKRNGFNVHYFGGSKGGPDFKNYNHENGHVWIFDPGVAHGAFKDLETGNSSEDYTRIWRIFHELAHALTAKQMKDIYGEGRRAGRLGYPLTLNECKRAVHWEDVTFKLQKTLMEAFDRANGGNRIKITEEDFNREYNTNLADAVYRCITGDFGDPDLVGFVPSNKLISLEQAFKILEDHAEELGINKSARPNINKGSVSLYLPCIYRKKL